MGTDSTLCSNFAELDLKISEVEQLGVRPRVRPKEWIFRSAVEVMVIGMEGRDFEDRCWEGHPQGF